jgi:heme/copper-type cytochrome/quinol oxidase subunit 2
MRKLWWIIMALGVIAAEKSIWSTLQWTRASALEHSDVLGYDMAANVSTLGVLALALPVFGIMALFLWKMLPRTSEEALEMSRDLAEEERKKARRGRYHARRSGLEVAQ